MRSPASFFGRWLRACSLRHNVSGQLRSVHMGVCADQIPWPCAKNATPQFHEGENRRCEGYQDSEVLFAQIIGDDIAELGGALLAEGRFQRDRPENSFFR